MSGFTDNRDFVINLIGRYRTHACLWQVTHEHYRNQIKRKRALDDMVELFRTIDPQANQLTVLNKINSLKGSYNKELRKVRASMRTGLKAHVPKLWYFNHLTFLQDRSSPRKCRVDSPVLDKHETSFIIKEDIEDITTSSHAFDNQPSPSRSQQSTPSRLSTVSALADQIIAKIGRRIDEPIESVSVAMPEKLHEPYGQYIAEKLRTMPKSMVPLCQKLINEVIFLAEMNSLNMSSRIVTDSLPSSSTVNNHAEINSLLLNQQGESSVFEFISCEESNPKINK